jgi:hypothetical protein
VRGLVPRACLDCSHTDESTQESTLIGTKQCNVDRPTAPGCALAACDQGAPSDLTWRRCSNEHIVLLEVVPFPPYVLYDKGAAMAAFEPEKELAACEQHLAGVAARLKGADSRCGPAPNWRIRRWPLQRSLVRRKRPDCHGDSRAEWTRTPDARQHRGHSSEPACH